MELLKTMQCTTFNGCCDIGTILDAILNGGDSLPGYYLRCLKNIEHFWLTSQCLVLHQCHIALELVRSLTRGAVQLVPPRLSRTSRLARLARLVWHTSSRLVSHVGRVLSRRTLSRRRRHPDYAKTAARHRCLL